MTKQDLIDLGFEDFLVFEDPSFDGCIVGVSHDNRPIYSMSLMLDWLIEHKICNDFSEAADFISSDTIESALCTSGAPIIMICSENDYL